MADLERHDGPGTPSALRFTAGKVRRHLHWARTQGISRLVEEDQLDPVARVRTARQKAAWRRRSGRPPGQARPVWVVGLQRSGTNMLVRGLEQAPEVEVHNENDRRLFDRFQLRSRDVVEPVLHASRHDLVLLKPLADSHRTTELLTWGPPGGRAVWVYRDVDGRTRSALAKFGDSNLQFLRAFAAGQAGSAWQAGGLEEQELALVRSFDLAAMTPETACSLFWYLRNDLFFKAGLHRRDDVVAIGYAQLVASPETTLSLLCDALDFPYRPDLSTHVERREPPHRAPLDVDPRVRALCHEMGERLAEASLSTVGR